MNHPNIIDLIFISGKISHYFALVCRCLGAMPVVLVVLTALPTPFVRVVNLWIAWPYDWERKRWPRWSSKYEATFCQLSTTPQCRSLLCLCFCFSKTREHFMNKTQKTAMDNNRFWHVLMIFRLTCILKYRDIEELVSADNNTG